MSANATGNIAPGNFAVKLDFFSGPMDLLLHLVRQQEVSIERVDMTEVCEQYLHIITETAELDLDRASEYLVVAATLLSIKSQALLPTIEAEEESDGFENPEEAMRFYEELRRRLLAYEETKRLAISLVEAPQLGVDVFSRKDKKALQPDPEELGEGQDAFSLGVAFAKLLKRIGETVHSMRIRLEPISVVSFMMKVIDSLSVKTSDAGSSHSFRSLVRTFVNPVEIRKQAASEEANTHARGVIIGSFVAVLELMKRGLIVASQDSSGEITLGARVEDIGERHQEREHFLASMHSEFDEEETPIENNENVVAMDSYREERLVEEDSTENEEIRKEVNRG